MTQDPKQGRILLDKLIERYGAEGADEFLEFLLQNKFYIFTEETCDKIDNTILILSREVKNLRTELKKTNSN